MEIPGWEPEPQSPATMRRRFTAHATPAPPCRADQPNAYLDGQGHLVLVAVRTAHDCHRWRATKITSPVYTSARITSVPSFRYGRIEASIRIPAAARGVWPAFWALGQEGRRRPLAGGRRDRRDGAMESAARRTRQDRRPDRSRRGPRTAGSPGSGTGFLDQSADFVFPAPSRPMACTSMPSSGRRARRTFSWTATSTTAPRLGSLTGKEQFGSRIAGPFSLLLNLAMGGGFFGYPDAQHRRHADDGGRLRPRLSAGGEGPRSRVGRMRT